MAFPDRLKPTRRLHLASEPGRLTVISQRRLLHSVPFALMLVAWMIYWVWQRAGDPGRMASGLLAGCILLLLGLLLGRPREIATSFDLQRRRVLQVDRRALHARPRSKEFAFADIASVGARKDRDLESGDFMPIVRLKSGRTHRLAVESCAKTEVGIVLDQVSAATGLPRIDGPR